jgi:hypothetical protein
MNLELIYKYMGWCEKCKKCNPNIHHNREVCARDEMDSNKAWECVQEMEKQGHADEFETYLYTCWCDAKVLQCQLVWEKNPTNFFSCMGAWLEGREDKCEVNPFLSCVCSKGTKCCDKQHQKEGV